MRRLLRLGFCDGVSTVGGGVRKYGFKDGGAVEPSVSGFVRWLPVLSQVLR